MTSFTTSPPDEMQRAFSQTYPLHLKRNKWPFFLVGINTGEHVIDGLLRNGVLR
jgi:hypothetical protein